jgi:hypothetical protein
MVRFLKRAWSGFRRFQVSGKRSVQDERRSGGHRRFFALIRNRSRGRTAGMEKHGPTCGSVLRVCGKCRWVAVIRIGSGVSLSSGRFRLAPSGITARRWGVVAMWGGLAGGFSDGAGSSRDGLGQRCSSDALEIVDGTFLRLFGRS